jgi:ankyrin repeat protein
VKEAVSAVRLNSLKVLLDAVPDEYSRELQQYALIRACRTHKASYNSAQDTHASCFPKIRPILEFLLQDCDIDINEVWSYQDKQKKQHWSTAMSCMIQHGCVDGVQWLVKVAGVDVNSTWGEYKHSALHILSNSWLSDERAITQLITTLMSLGADISMTTSSGATILHAAALNQNEMVLEQLVTLCNSDMTEAPLIAHQDHQGHTPLHVVVLMELGCRQHKSRRELMALLLKCSSADLAQAFLKQDNAGRTVLHCAVQLHRLQVLGQLLTACSNANVLSSLLLTRDDTGQTVITLVRRVGGDSITSAVLPYCTEVRS